MSSEELSRARAALDRGRSRLLQLDPEAAAAAASLLPSHEASNEDAGVPLALLDHWCAIARGEPERVIAGAEALERRAARAGLAAETIEAAALRALAEEQRSDLAAALHVARRAMRMARTETVPEGEHLAALVLARVRRRSNQAHLAARIAGALRRYAMPAYRRWIDWELTLATGGVDDADAGTELRDGPASALATWLGTAAAGDRARFDGLGADLAAAAAEFEPAKIDLRDARLAIDPDADASGHPAFAAWRSGRAVTLPPGSSGLAGASTAGAIACVLVRPGMQRGVRVLRVGAALGGGVAAPASAAPAKHARTEALIAVLALAGPEGLADEEAFSGAYDFTFVPERHRDTFNVAIHRARAHVEGVGEIVRHDGRLRLRVDRRVAFQDPRCTRPLTDQVLRCIAIEGRMAARAVSDRLGVSLRSAQSALEELLGDGSCQRHKAGRSVEYAVEDTTFQEPTGHR